MNASAWPDDWTIITRLRRHLPSDELPGRALCGAFPGVAAVKYLTACHICERIDTGRANAAAAMRGVMTHDELGEVHRLWRAGDVLGAQRLVVDHDRRQRST